MSQPIGYDIEYSLVSPALPSGPQYKHISHKRLISPISETVPMMQENAAGPEPEEHHSPAAWGIGWRYPVLMLSLFLCGILLSVGHHLYYQSLDNTLVQSAEQQSWAIRIGTGLAFLIKTVYVAAIGIAAAQQIWATLRRKSVSLRGIDGMFHIMNNPSAFLIADVWTSAASLTVLAIVSWLLPLTAIITPATLSVHSLMTSNVTQTLVPTVNLTTPNWNSWFLGEGWGYISAPTFGISRLFTNSFSSAAPIPLSAPFPNSSYTLEFWGPSYKCQNLSETLSETSGMTFSDGSGTEYNSFQDVWNEVMGNSSLSLMYKGAAPQFLDNMLLLYAAGWNPLWDNTTQYTYLTCQLWNTSYVVDLHFTNGVQKLVPLSTELVSPANWSYTVGQDAYQSGVNGVFFVTHLLFSNFFSGSLTIGVSGGLSVDLGSLDSTTMPLLQSALVGCPELWNDTVVDEEVGVQPTALCRNGTLARAVEDLSRNFTYSILSLNSSNIMVPVTVSYPQNFYAYNHANLLAAYILALLVTASCILVGLFALWENGVPHNTSFSSVMCTTRNRELDSLAIGFCLGSGPLAQDISETRLRFGEIDAPQQFKHAAFGLENSVNALKKGETYY